jgi:predicted esterase
MASMMSVARGVADESMIVASIQGPHQFLSPALETGNFETVGFGWQTPFRSEDSVNRHHQLVRRVIREAATLYRADSSRTFLMGFSQACSMNYRLVFTHPGLFRGAIGVCGGIPGDFRDPKYRHYDGSILHVAATRDQYYPLERSRAFGRELLRLADDVTLHEYDAPHAFPRRAIPLIRRWILSD